MDRRCRGHPKSAAGFYRPHSELSWKVPFGPSPMLTFRAPCFALKSGRPSWTPAARPLGGSPPEGSLQGTPPGPRLSPASVPWLTSLYSQSPCHRCCALRTQLPEAGPERLVCGAQSGGGTGAASSSTFQRVCAACGLSQARGTCVLAPLGGCWGGRQRVSGFVMDSFLEGSHQEGAHGVGALVRTKRPQRQGQMRASVSSGVPRPTPSPGGSCVHSEPISSFRARG